MDELLVIKDKVTEEHKLVDEWTRWTSERVASNKRQGNRRTQVSRQVNRLTSERVACNKRQGNRRTQVSRRVDWKTDL